MQATIVPKGTAVVVKVVVTVGTCIRALQFPSRHRPYPLLQAVSTCRGASLYSRHTSSQTAPPPLVRTNPRIIFTRKCSQANTSQATTVRCPQDATIAVHCQPVRSVAWCWQSQSVIQGNRQLSSTSQVDAATNKPGSLLLNSADPGAQPPLMMQQVLAIEACAQHFDVALCSSWNAKACAVHDSHSF